MQTLERSDLAQRTNIEQHNRLVEGINTIINWLNDNEIGEVPEEIEVLKQQLQEAVEGLEQQLQEVTEEIGEIDIEALQQVVANIEEFVETFDPEEILKSIEEINNIIENWEDTDVSHLLPKVTNNANTLYGVLENTSPQATEGIQYQYPLEDFFSLNDFVSLTGDTVQAVRPLYNQPFREKIRYPLTQSAGTTTEIATKEWVLETLESEILSALQGSY